MWGVGEKLICLCLHCQMPEKVPQGPSLTLSYFNIEKEPKHYGYFCLHFVDEIAEEHRG